MSTFVPSGAAGATAREGPGGLPPLQSFSNFPIFGPIAIGTFIGILGTGALIMGTIMFFDRYPIHKRRTRLLLFTVVSLNVAQTVSDCSRLIKITIIDPSLTHFIDVRVRPEEVLSPALSAAICTLVQIYLAHSGITFYRAGVAPTGRSSVAFVVKFWSICVLLALGIALGFGAGLGTAIYIRMLPNYIYASRVVDSDGVFPTLTTIWLSATAATDILVTAVIITQVWSAIRRRDKRSRAVWALVHLLAQSGLLVTALQIAALITYLKSHTSWSDFPMIFISKVYSLTLLASYCMPRSAMCEVDTGESTHDHDRPARSPPRRPTQPPLTPSRFLQSWRDHDVATITPATIRGNLNRHRNPSLDSHAVPLHPIDSGRDAHEQLHSPYSVTVGEKTSPRVMGMSPWNRGAKNGGSGWRRYDHSRSDSDEAYGESTGKVYGVLDL